MLCRHFLLFPVLSLSPESLFSSFLLWSLSLMLEAFLQIFADYWLSFHNCEWTDWKLPMCMDKLFWVSPLGNRTGTIWGTLSEVAKVILSLGLSVSPERGFWCPAWAVGSNVGYAGFWGSWGKVESWWEGTEGVLGCHRFSCRFEASPVFSLLPFRPSEIPVLLIIQSSLTPTSHTITQFSNFAKLVITCPLAFPTVQNCADIPRLLSSSVTRSTSIF